MSHDLILIEFYPHYIHESKTKGYNPISTNVFQLLRHIANIGCGISQGVFLGGIHESKNGFVLTLRKLEFLRNMKLKNQKTQKSGAD